MSRKTKGGRHTNKHTTGYIPDRGRCGCGKRIYRRHEARKVARTLARNTSEKLVDYVCPDTGVWHVGHNL